MPVPLAQFVKRLEESGILAGNTLKNFVPPKADPKDGDELARELVRKKKLTKFQAEEVYRGKGKALVLGNYTILDKIGAGGMGQVFKAEHRRMRRIVAIKMLPVDMTKNPAVVARFEREVMAAAKLNHPNIVTAFDADNANDVHFLVMECVDGSDLSALVKKNGAFPVEQAVNYVLQAARGLEAAHAEGIVHRDIKPANLLLDKKGTVKILDMGLARIETTGDVATQAELTGTGAVMGTVDYMAPEQALSTKTADARADIYSLGCSLFYLLTGKATYDGETITAKLIAHQSHPIPELRPSCGEAPAELEAVFQKMVAKKTSDRYQTISEVIADLERLTSRKVQAADMPTSSGASTDTGLSDFLKDISLEPVAPARRRKAASKNNDWIKKNKKLLLIGGGILGAVVLLAGIVITFKTKDGTLTLTVNEPDAEVQVLTEEGKVQITRNGEKGGPITISVDPGKHRLKVEKAGFELYTDNFEIKSGGTKSITAKLVPKVKQATVAEKEGWHGWPADAPAPAIAPFDAAQAKKHQLAWADYLKLPVEFTNSVGMKFVLIPPGEFTMGSSATEIEQALPDALGDGEVRKLWQACIKSEAPQHQVVLTQPIFLGVYEVTQKEYAAVMGSNPSDFSATGKYKADVAGIDTTSRPVEQVSWNDAAEFCAKLSQKEELKPFYLRAGETIRPLEGTGYRLPSEAEWEFACRAGTKTKFWIGDKNEDLARAGWFEPNSGGRTQTVGELKANPLGLYDVHGNVCEWVEDWREPRYYEQFADKPAINPQGPSSAGSLRVVRGGVWFQPASCCRASFHYGHEPTERHHHIGFRVSLNVDAGPRVSSVSANASLRTPAGNAFQQWIKDVGNMPAEMQVEAVLKKLRELNPGFDGRGTHEIYNGAVRSLSFVTDHVTDISPVQALVNLKDLGCTGSEEGKGRLEDLSSLSSLPLDWLICCANPLTDLSPLRGMRLEGFDCTHTNVSDLSILRGMPLTWLHCGGAPISDLSPLAGLALANLNCAMTPVTQRQLRMLCHAAPMCWFSKAFWSSLRVRNFGGAGALWGFRRGHSRLDLGLVWQWWPARHLSSRCR